MSRNSPLRRPLATAAAASLSAVLFACAPGATPTPALPGSPSPEPSPTEPGASPGAPVGDVTVVVDDIAFGQSSVNVPSGTPVRWQNDDVVAHTVTHGQNGSAAADLLFDLVLPTGEAVEHTFDEAGTYSVTCTIHPQMNMTVEVE